MTVDGHELYEELHDRIADLKKENLQLRSQLREKEQVINDLKDQCVWLRESLKDFVGFVDR